MNIYLVLKARSIRHVTFSQFLQYVDQDLGQDFEAQGHN